MVFSCEVNRAVRLRVTEVVFDDAHLAYGQVLTLEIGLVECSECPDEIRAAGYPPPEVPYSLHRRLPGEIL